MQHAAGAPILFWFAFPSFFTNFEFLMCPFFTIPFFAWHHTETVLVLHQTPLKLHVFTSEVSRTQHPARCRPWPFFISLWILGNNHALITRPALARAPWQWVSCTRKHQRCNSRSSLSRQRTLKISLELPGAHSLGLFFAIKFHHKNICKTRIPSAVRATHCGKLHVWFSRLEAFRSSCCKASSQEGHIDKEEAMARGSKTGLSCPQAMQRWFSSAFVTRNKWWQRVSNSFMVSTSMMRGIVGKILLQKSRCLRYRWSCKIASAVARQTQANGQCWWLCNRTFKVAASFSMYDHRSAKVPDCAMAPQVLGNGPHCHASLRTATSEIMNMAVSSCIPFSSTNRSKT